MQASILLIITAVLASSLESTHHSVSRRWINYDFRVHSRNRLMSLQPDIAFRSSDKYVSSSSLFSSTNKSYNRRVDIDPLDRILYECQQTKVYFPAVAAANALLADDSIFLSSYQVSLIIKCFGAAAMVDDAMNVIDTLVPTQTVRQRATLSIVNYNAVLSVCKTHKRFQQAVDFFERIYDSSKQNAGFAATPAPDAVTHSTMIACLCELNRWEQALAMYEEYQSKNNAAITNEKLIGSLITGLKKCKQFNLCIELYDEYRSNGGSSSIFLENSMMNIYGESSRWQEALSIFHNMENASQPPNLKPDKISVLTISSILRKAEQFDELRRIQKLYPQQRIDDSSAINSPHATSPVAPIRIPLNALLKEAQQFGKNEAARKGALEFLASPPSSWTPGGITTCIEIFGFIREPEMAMQVLRVMVSQKKKPNTQHYNAAMNVCVRNGLYQDALDLFHEMSVQDQYSIGIALKAFNGLGQWREAFQLFETLQIGAAAGDEGSGSRSSMSAIQANSIMLNTMLDILGSAKQWKKVFELYNQLVMVCNQQTRDSDIVSRVIYSKPTQSSKDYKIDKDVKIGVLALDKYTKFAILDKLEKDQQYDMIAYLKSQWAARPTRPEDEAPVSPLEVIPFEVVDSLILKRGDSIKMEPLPPDFQHKSEMHSTRDDENDSSIGESKFRLLEGLEEVSSVMPTSEAGTLFEKLLENPNGSVVEVLRLAGRIDEALDIMDQLHIAGKRAHPSFYDAAIVACSPLGDWERAMIIHEKMKQNGITLSSRTGQLLLHILKEFADPEVYESMLINVNQPTIITAAVTDRPVA